jgi:hypothetical protein
MDISIEIRLAVYKSLEQSGNIALAHWFWEHSGEV